MMGVITGVALCLRVAWRVGAARAEEDAGRLEQLLVRPLPRWRWLAGHVVVAAVDVVLLALVTGAATWVGAVVGGADVSGADAVAAMVNPCRSWRSSSAWPWRCRAWRRGSSSA